MNRLTQGRAPFVLILLVCLGLLAYAYYAQFVLDLAPCPLCMLQRFGFMIMAVVSLVAAVHNPGRLGRWLYGIPFFGGAIWGMITAGQHVHLQSQPADPMVSCGADWQTMIDFDYTANEILREAFTASGNCAEVDWTFVGISMPGWALIWYVLLSGLMLWALFAKKH